MSGTTGVSSEVGGNPQGPFCAADSVFCPARSPRKLSADSTCVCARRGLLQASSCLKSTVLIILQVIVWHFLPCLLPFCRLYPAHWHELSLSHCFQSQQPLGFLFSVWSWVTQGRPRGPEQTMELGCIIWAPLLCSLLAVTFYWLRVRTLYHFNLSRSLLFISAPQGYCEDCVR